jgi:hypothetical protein
MAGGCHPGPVTPSDDLSPPRRPIFFPVVIATVFLTIIGMTAGFVLGERHREKLRAANPDDTTAVVTPYPGVSAGFSEPSGPLCPDETIAFAAANRLRTDLHQVLKITTRNDTVVWICEDGAGSFYYQSHTKASSGPLVQNKNGLFLTDVSRAGENEYVAVSHEGNRFQVSDQRLRVTFADGSTPQESSVRSVG